MLGLQDWNNDLEMRPTCKFSYEVFSFIHIDNLWQRAFGANPNILGQSVIINSRGFKIIGVMPAGFEFPRKADLWVPLAWDEKERQLRHIHDYLEHV